MNKVILKICMVLLSLVFNIFSQNIDWIKSIGTTMDDYGNCVASDSISGYVYIAGIFDTIISPNDTIGMPFLEAYSSTGTFIWRLNITNSNNSEILSNGFWIGTPKKIIISDSGYIYLCGLCCNSVQLDSINLPKNSRFGCGSGGPYDLFIAKINSSGHALWAKRFDGQAPIEYRDFSVSKDGIYVCASTSDAININTISYGSGSPAFICKFSHSGELAWFKFFNGYNQGMALNTNLSPMQLILSFGNGASLNGQTLLNNGEKGLVFSRINKDGNISLGSTIKNVDLFYLSKAIDLNGNIYIAGTYDSSVTLGQYFLPLKSDPTFFIAKFNSSDSITWLKSPSYCRWDARGMAVGYIDITYSSNDHLYFTGSFSGSLAFDSDTLNVDTLLAPVRWRRFDGFVFSFNNSGVADWSAQFSGAKIDYINCASPLGQSTLYLTGGYDSAATFLKTSIVSKGLNDAFICKVSLQSNSISNQSSNHNSQEAFIKPHFYLGLITKYHLNNHSICYNLLGKRIVLSNNDTKLLGKLAIIRKK